MARTIARFEVERDLASTPLGTVSKAKDPKSGRELVLRAVRLDAPGAQDFLLRLKQQAKAASALKSPNIAAIYGAGTEPGLFFVALEYVSGATLRELIQRGQRLSPSEFVDLARQVCSAFDHAQHRNLFHAALHPGNVMIEADGTAKIMDFGIPKDAPVPEDERSAYLSPEQLTGALPDLKSNLFSWAAILYEVATGQKAFSGIDRDTPPRAPQEFSSALPGAIGRAILKALAKDSNQRYASPSDFVSALENYEEAPKAPAATPVAVLRPAQSAQVSAYTAMPPVPPPPQPPPQGVVVARPTPPPPAPEATSPIEHVYTGPVSGEDKVEAPPAVPPKFARAKTELKRAAHQAAVTVRAPETEARVKKGLPYALAAMAVLALALLGMAGYYFVEARIQNWRAQRVSETAPAPAEAASAPAPAPAAAPSAEETQPAEPPAEAAPEPESLEAVATTIRPRKKAAPRAPAMPAALVLTTGELAVSSLPPGAQVQIDGRADTGWQTPLVASRLSPGAHTVTLAKPGFAVRNETVQIEAGKRTTFAASLAELGATVAVVSAPPGARILVDGRDTGRVTPTKLVLEKGSHTFTLLRPGYFEFTSQGQFNAGQNAEINATLRVMGNIDEVRTAGRLSRFTGRPKDMASLQIRTQPKGARIDINGRTMEKSTPAEFFLPAGQYEVVVTAPGYKPLRKVVTLETASKMVLEESMQR